MGETMPNPAYLDRIAEVLDAPELAEFADDEESRSMGDHTAMLAALAVALEPYHPSRTRPQGARQKVSV